MKTLTDLIDPTNSGWQFIQDELKNAKNPYQILPPNLSQAEQNLLYLQITTKSTMGAIAYHTGGILVNNGWVRILGSGDTLLPRSLERWNTTQQSDGFLLIADDVVGGYFALNGGAFGEAVGQVFYFAPDTLQWESLGVGYTDFVIWALTGDFEQFYQNLRWQNWQHDLTVINSNQVFSFMPFLWTSEGKDIENTSKKAVSIFEDYPFKQGLISQ